MTVHRDNAKGLADTRKFGVSAPAWLVDAVDAERRKQGDPEKEPKSRSACVVEALEDWLYTQRRRSAA